MNYISSNKIENKRILLRCDFNVPVKNNKVVDDSKIIRSIDTIKLLLNNNNKVIILSHFGRIKSEDDKINNTLYPVYEELKKYIDIDFISDPFNLDDINNSNKLCFLVENTRYTDVPEKKESINDLELSKYWSQFADVFVIDAFASLHRAHSSTAGISNYLKTYFGLLVEEEINNLEPLINNNKHPFTVIMGGAKASDKIKIIEGILERCDKLILTGGILNTFLKVIGKSVGKSLVSDDEDVLESVKNILDKYENKIFFSNEFKINRNNEILTVLLDEIEDNDIIYDNLINNKIFTDSKIIFFNGTCGMYEDNNYKSGTQSLLKDLSHIESDVYIGGGDTVTAVNTLGFNNEFKYLSSGGGATLEYVAYGKLKALEYIKENGVI